MKNSLHASQIGKTESFVEIDAAKVAFGIDGSGPGLMLLHGTGGNSETNWSQLVELLAKSRTVIRPDFSGSGETVDDGRPLTVPMLATQVVAVARKTGSIPFDLVGFSLGAPIAIYLAAEYPDLVRSVVLISGFTTSADTRFKLQFALWRGLIRTDRKAMAGLLLLTGFSPDFLASMDEGTLHQTIDTIIETNNWDGMARQVELDMIIDVRDFARRLTQPVLVIGCTYDNMVPPAHSRSLASVILNARYVEIETGHLSTLEKPTEVAQLVLGFVNSDTAGSHHSASPSEANSPSALA